MQGYHGEPFTPQTWHKSKEQATTYDIIRMPVQNYPLVICYIAIENGHTNSEISPLKMVIFHSYVKLPEGNWWFQPP